LQRSKGEEKEKTGNRGEKKGQSARRHEKKKKALPRNASRRKGNPKASTSGENQTYYAKLIAETQRVRKRERVSEKKEPFPEKARQARGGGPIAAVTF